ncbi:FAD-dependent oxidoreductase [Sulfurimonas sp. HSL-1716]|uniref:FAD-dependent oxidoreductase n=1 Tax=Hydrocurvibacter sulfurireducens TaxID=3131937 RepID=UPI0031F9D464
MEDVLVIGAGGAGLVAALSAKESGADVKVLTKNYPTRSQTCMAQGGINAALSNAKEDSKESHYENTLKSAHGIADEKMVKKLCDEGVDAVLWLDRIGVPFSRDENGNIAQRRLGGASAPRACYAQDYTGLKILHTLYDQCNANDIEMLSERFLLELIVEDGEVGGAVVLNMKTGETETHHAKSVILATGGYSRLYGKNSTNAVGSTGDGIAAALRAGAKLSDMEFVQFHPTGLKNSSILISESARGEGGHLLNKEGERFTDELAPRDKVSRAIHEEIQKSGEVYIDIRHLGEKFIDHQLPQERKLAKLYENVDPVYDLIPIKPVAHYTMGGIAVDADSQTNIKGLFAVGECANHKVHGANRLGGNSLLELIVFGREAGKNASSFAKQSTHTPAGHQSHDDFLKDVKNSAGSVDFYKKRDELAECFYENVGIKRDEPRLLTALSFVQKLKEQIPLMGVRDTNSVYNTELVEFLEFKNMIEIALSVAAGAIKRKESRGAHFREDMPNEDDAFQTNTIYYKNGDELCIDLMK